MATRVPMDGIHLNVGPVSSCGVMESSVDRYKVVHKTVDRPNNSAHIDAPSLSPSLPLIRTMAEIELNKDGSVSRKRLHSGNLPSIPRTEECHICSAKFTRHASSLSDHLYLLRLTHPPPPDPHRLNHLKRHLLTRKPRYSFMPVVKLINGACPDTDSRKHECEVNRLALHQTLSPALTKSSRNVTSSSPGETSSQSTREYAANRA